MNESVAQESLYRDQPLDIMGIAISNIIGNMAESKSGKSEVVEKAKQVGGGGGSTGSPMVDLAIKIKKEMEGFYKSESSSTIDLQSMLKDRGFSNLSLDCE